MHPTLKSSDSGKPNGWTRSFTTVLSSLFLLSIALWVSTWFFRWAYPVDIRRAAVLMGMLSLLVGQSGYVKALCQTLYRALTERHFIFCLLSALLGLAVAISVFRVLSFQFPVYDVGLFQQVLWALSQGHGFHSTVSGAGNFLLDHLSLSLLLLVPFYWMLGSSKELLPFLLPVLHSVLLLGGVSAWVWWTFHHFEDRKIRFVLCSVALFSSSIWGNLLWGFHENAIGFCALSWMLALALSPELELERNLSLAKKWILASLFLVTCFSKETLLLDGGLTLTIVGTYRFIKLRKAKNLTAGVIPVLGVMLILVFIFFQLLPHPVDKNYFGRYYSYLGNSISDMGYAILMSPLESFKRYEQAVGLGAALKYSLLIMSGFSFLPLLSLFKSGLSVFLVPSFLMTVLASFAPLRFINYHYSLELLPILFFLSAYSLVILKKWFGENAHRFKRGFSFSRATLVLGVIPVFLLRPDPFSELVSHIREARAQSEFRAQIRHLFIEKDPVGGVFADEHLGTWVTSRYNVARIPEDFKLLECPKWVVLRASSRLEVLSLPKVKDCFGVSPRSVWSRSDWEVWAL